MTVWVKLPTDRGVFQLHQASRTNRVENLEQDFKAHHRDSSESRQWAFSISTIHNNDTEVMTMSRTFDRKHHDESNLTTLCPRCLDAFCNTRGICVRRADTGQTVKEPCTYCQTRFGFDYYIQPAAPKSAYTKKGRFDDELICA